MTLTGTSTVIVSMLSDYVRLAVHGRSHPLGSACYQIKWTPLVLARAKGRLSASMYFLAVLLWIPNSRAIPRINDPLYFGFCTAFHLAI